MTTSFFYIYIDIYITFTNWRSIQMFYWTQFFIFVFYMIRNNSSSCSLWFSMFDILSQGEHCPKGWTSLIGGCYKFFNEKVSRKEAKKKCHLLSGRLVDIKSEEQNNALYEEAYRKRKLHQLWIGLNDIAKEGEFVTTSGEKPCYTNWHPNEPNNYAGSEDCAVVFWRESTKWNDLPCHVKRNFICQLHGI